MKRCLTMVLVVLLSIATISASAVSEEYDFSELTDEELMEVNSLINEEMKGRGIDSTIIYDGIYTVGEDIRAGHWEIINADPEGSAVVAMVANSIEELNNWKDGPLVSYDFFYPGSVCYLSLKDGMVLGLTIKAGTTCYIQEVEKSFAP